MAQAVSDHSSVVIEFKTDAEADRAAALVKQLAESEDADNDPN